MANWSLPLLTDTYTNFRLYLSDRLNDAAKMFDSATTTPTDQPVGSKRWNSTSNKFEKWSGSAWSDLASSYGISISGNAATATIAGTADNVTTVTLANIIDGLGYTPFSAAGGNISGPINVSGLIAGSSGLSIVGNAAVSGALHVTGTSQFDLNLGVSGSLTVATLISCAGLIASTDGILKTSGYGGDATRGLIYFGNGNTYIYKIGDVFQFNLEGVGTAVISKGGTVAMTSDIPASGVSLDHGADNIGALCLCENTTNSLISTGSTISGASLRPTNATGSTNGEARSGTWRCLGASSSSNNVTLYQRIA